MTESKGPFSVLLVENDADDLLCFKKGIEQNSRFASRIDSARTFEEALQKLASNHYHLILVESKVQDQDGLLLLEKIQEKKIELPFILMTPIPDDKLVREAMNKGVAEVIIKSESQYDQLADILMNSYQKFHNITESRELIDRINDGEQTSQLESAPPSIKDELTGLFNHGYMHERIVREFSRASRYSYPISCLLLDIDKFKTINDEKGYRAGDILLKESAQLLFNSCRLSDIIARYGGTEFLVLLPHISYQGALQASKRLRKIFAEHVFLQGTENIEVTVSVGAASYPEDDMKRRSDMINFARKALLQSKAMGRNRATMFRDLERVNDGLMPKLEISEDKIQDFQQRISEVADSARREYLHVSRDLLEALESKDSFTAGHGANCAKYAKQIAAAVGMTTEEIESVENGALLHDIGKICIPDVILLKTGKLTFNEFEVMKQHTYYGYKVLKPIKFMRDEALITLHHHEWFNGEGYPCHLKAEEIPLGARIVAVVDAFDTMRAAGARYKKTITVQDAVAELITMSGSQFDPVLVKAFIEVLIERSELPETDYDKEALARALRKYAPRKDAA